MMSYNRVVMVVGSDRVREFDTLLKRYNDVSPDMDIITLKI